MNNLIEQTKQNLILQHGENKTGTLNGRTYRVINEYYEAFNRFQNAFFALAKSVNFPVEKHEKELEIIFEFCKNCEYCDMDAITNVLVRKNENLKNKLKPCFKKFNDLFEDLNEIALTGKIDFNKVKMAFAKNFNCVFVSNSDIEFKRKRAYKSHLFRSF